MFNMLYKDLDVIEEYECMYNNILYHTLDSLVHTHTHIVLMYYRSFELRSSG